MINKQVSSAADAVRDVFDGATVMVGGFGEAGSPIELIHALIDHGATDLTVVSNNTGSGEVGLAALLKAGRVSKVICSFPRTANSTVFPDLYRSGKTTLELVPQGTLAERIRAGGAGIPGFYTPAAVGTPLAEGKELRTFDGHKIAIVQVNEVVEPGQIDPEVVVSPGIFVNRVVAVPNPVHESDLVAAGVSYP